MRKYLMIGDTHAGLRQDNPWNEENLYNVFVQIVEHCKANGITEAFHAGDFFDVRKATTQTTMKFIRERIVPLLEEAGLHIYVLVGNHDCQFKDKIRPNSPREILDQYDCFTVVDEPMTVNLDTYPLQSIDLIPWICQENTQQIFDFIKKSKSQYCLGHFELSGYYFYKNSKADHGLEPDFLKKYDIVYSGHYHHANEGANVFYIGTPLTMSANDEDETRGFYELSYGDGKRELTFIANPVCHHRRITYPDQKDVDVADYKNCSVRLIVREVDNDLPKFQTKLEETVYELNIVDRVITDSEVDTDFEIKSVSGLISEYINNMQITPEEKTEVSAIMSALYAEVTSNGNS